ncbi:uncharacterized protein LOC9659068 [Selaginella moellendorffii]|nr:uncharacterized protein LOC9659068 [Selaginella moellendorffii]|eukprot:XP_002965250.2 uncharacterized protein LOC9659068 [Selaginella moellendorffii]
MAAAISAALSFPCSRAFQGCGDFERLASRPAATRPLRSKGLRAMAQDRQAPAVVEKLGIKVEKEPSDARLRELGVKTWPKWGCTPSKFPWTYDARETCYLLEGKVKVYPEGSSDEFVEISAGDLVVFPKGMSCTWDVAATVDKHYKFD